MTWLSAGLVNCLATLTSRWLRPIGVRCYSHRTARRHWQRSRPVSCPRYAKRSRGGKLWLAHSRKHRDREEQLIPISDWQAMRGGFLSAMSLTADPEKYLARLCEKVQHSLSELATAVDEGRVTIDGQGHLHIPAIVALDVEPEVARTRDSIFEIIGRFSTGNCW
jgi:hypothetical protein